MKDFFLLIFFRFKMIFKDDVSAIALLSYFLSLNVFTILGYYKLFFQHSSLSQVPLYYSLIIMLAIGIFTRFILIDKPSSKNFMHRLKENLIVYNRKSLLVTLAYIVSSFVLMFTVA